MKADPDQIVAITPDEDTPPGKLPFWIVHALNCAGITTYTQLSNYDATAIMLIPGMSSSMAVARIRDELARRNLSLGPLVCVPGPKALPDAQQACCGAAGGGDPRCPTIGGSDPTPPAPNGGWHAGLTAQGPQIRATSPQPAPEQASLRDQFAMAALSGLLVSQSGGPRVLAAFAHEYCETAYALADAMMKERKKEEN